MASDAAPSVPTATSDNIKVVVRVRPLNGDEVADSCESCVVVDTDANSLAVGDRSFAFGAVLGTTTAQDHVYDATLRPVIPDFIAGFNVTVLAYGQTGSGKTHTMSGSAAVPGVIPRAVEDVFTRLPSGATVSVTYLELYNDTVRDLLYDGPGEPPVVTIREDTSASVVVSGLTHVPVASPDAVRACLTAGGRARATAATAMNATSSRSHAVCTLTLRQPAAADGSSPAVVSTLNLVDLAGSERQRKTQAEGARLREATSINRGLLALGNCVTALVSGAGHVPYRDSKLTRLLQNALGGNSKTVMVACVSPADVHFSETVNTLRYASRAQRIQNCAKVNVEEGDAAVIAALRRQVQQLSRALLQAQAAGAPVDVDADAAAAVSAASATATGASAVVLQLLQRVTVLERANDALTADGVQRARDHRALMQAQEATVAALVQAETERDTWIWRCEAAGVAGDDHSGSPPSVVTEQAAEIARLTVEVARLRAAAPQRVDDDAGDDGAMDDERAGMLTELAALSAGLADKEKLMAQTTATDTAFAGVVTTYEAAIARLQEEVGHLEAERVKLASQLKGARGADAAQERTDTKHRLSQVGRQLQELKKQQKSRARVLLQKKRAEGRAQALGQQIAEMKAARVALVRRLKDASTKARTERAVLSRQLAQARKSASKAAFVAEKLQNQKHKQEAVLKRKTEALLAAKKQLAAKDDRRAFVEKRRLEREQLRKQRDLDVRAKRMGAGAGAGAGAGGKPTAKDASAADAASSCLGLPPELSAAVSDAVAIVRDCGGARHVPTGLRHTVLKELSARVAAANCQRLMDASVAKRRGLAAEMEAYKDAGASEEDVEPLRAKIATESARLSLLQTVVLPHTGCGGQLPGSALTFTDLKTAKAAARWLLRGCVELAAAVGAATSSAQTAATAHMAVETQLRGRLAAAVADAQRLQRAEASCRREAEERVLLAVQAAAMTGGGSDVTERVEALWAKLEAMEAEEAARFKDLHVHVSALAAGGAAAAQPRKRSKPAPRPEPKVVYLSASDLDDDDDDDSSDGGDAGGDEEWVPSPVRRQRERAAARLSNGSAKSSHRSHGGGGGGDGCACKGKCIRGCPCKSGGQRCGDGCKCARSRCTNGKAVEAVTKAPSVAPPCAADSSGTVTTIAAGVPPPPLPREQAPHRKAVDGSTRRPLGALQQGRAAATTAATTKNLFTPAVSGGVTL